MSTRHVETSGTLGNDAANGERPSQRELAGRIETDSSTLRRWLRRGVIRQYDGSIAALVGARSAGGEVLVTRHVVERAMPHLEFDRIGGIKLTRFSASTEMFAARLMDAEE